MFNRAIDSKLRGCDVVALKVEDVAPHGYAVERATVRQKRQACRVRGDRTHPAGGHRLHAPFDGITPRPRFCDALRKCLYWYLT
jgi:hypothetical protein